MATTQPTARRKRNKHIEIPPPSPEIVKLALDTLFSFLPTDSSVHLLSAIPSYEGSIENDRDEYRGNPLGFQAASITQLANCWQLFAPNFIRLTDQASPPSSRTNLVADHAWPVLGWIVSAFERNGLSVLGRQLPKTNSGPKIVLDTPLDIAFSAIEGPLDTQIRSIGVRLVRMVSFGNWYSVCVANTGG